MSTADAPATDIDRVLEAGLARAGQDAANDPLHALRRSGAERVRALGLPERRQETWRYTPVSFLKRAEYRPFTDGPITALQLSDIEDLLLDDHRGARLVFVNGHFAPSLSVTDGGAGLRIASLAEAEPDTFGAEDAAQYRHIFSALNAALALDGALIEVADGAELEHPIEILHIAVGGDEPVIVSPRHALHIGRGAQAGLIERYASLGESVYFDNVSLDVTLGANAELTHQCLQQESPTAQHLVDLDVRLGAGSRYRYTLAALGGDWSRSDVRVRFDGEGASAELNGLMLARDGQLNDVHLDVDHAVPGCTSVETFKSILDGQGRVVFDGHVLVARDAQKTDAALANHNLMLSRSAEVDTKPTLEIFADDVKCSHGTTVGELDKNMLFYLRSRGIPEGAATRMLCQGFAEDILGRFDDPALRARASRLLDERLAPTEE
ncbi:MAG: Fe-S cluster assembly protein SufD [Gammaproteobacteria bacterium]|nr:Fe-S cluster assembly protein SufD [Gammaproteobacteria bacterium]MCP5299656.1 Fe-S cluster assembly protein SufD [Chromatiaceae bacterium]